MPSLQVLKSSNYSRPQKHENSQAESSRSTFDEFYRKVTNNASSHSNSLIIAFIRCACTVNMINVLVYAIHFSLWDYLYTYHYNLYEQYELYYVENVPRVLSQFVVSTMIVFIFFNQRQNNSIKKICIISFIVNIVIGGGIALGLGIMYEENYPDNILYFKYVCNEIDIYQYSSDIVCQIYFSLFYIYFDCCVFSPVWLLITILINQIKIVSRVNGHYAITNSTSRKTTEMFLLSSDEFSQKQFDKHIGHDNDNYNDNHSSNHKSLIDTCFWLTCAMVWIVFNCATYLLSTIDEYSINVQIYFYALCITVFSFRVILKQIARRIDIFNVEQSTHNISYTHNINITIADETQNYNYYDYQNKHRYSYVHLISLEILMELLVNCVYFRLYYSFLVWHLSTVQISHGGLFFEVESYHILTEVIQSTVRFSAWYFYVSSRIVDFCERKFNKCSFIVEFFQDDSTLNEWRTRQSIDMSMRIFASTTQFITAMIYMYVKGRSTWGFGNAATFDRGILYCSISFAIDVLYFFLVFLYNLWCQQFNVWSPLLTIFQANSKIVIALFCVAVLLIQHLTTY